jgi:chromatin remodeling complex protein RSC6
MPRLSKSKTADVVDTPAVVNTPLTVAEAAVKVEKAKKPKAPKTETDVTVSTPVVTTTSVSTSVSASASASVSTPVVSTPVASDDAVVEDIEASIAAKSLEFSTKLNQLSSMIATLKTEYRSMEKVWARELKASQKLNSKKKKRAGNRAPSGFVKPTRISDELATFLGKDKGSEMARTDVTREINKYIRSHNLQDAANGRKINPDQKLQTLLKLKKTDELTYFNLQRYMSPHFQKAEKALAAAAAATTAV